MDKFPLVRQDSRLLIRQQTENESNESVNQDNFFKLRILSTTTNIQMIATITTHKFFEDFLDMSERDKRQKQLTFATCFTPDWMI
jgi:hypothetical protein